jgi:hypothetical protein
MNKVDLASLDVFFISYDEPNCEEHWSDLVSKVPWAKRVHGVYGSDAAHKECAKQSETERFITVDGDNVINPGIFDNPLDTTNFNAVDISKSVFSWSAINHINALVYGNGGIKCWPVDVVLNMRTHEIAEDDRSQVDFCWDIDYIQIDQTYSYVYNNGTPYQAYRAGFREGVKMSLHEGAKVDKHRMEEMIWPKNFHRLLIWNTVGADVLNGIWAVYGARLGTCMCNIENWDYRLVRDFKWHTEFWYNEVMPKFKGDTDLCVKSSYKWDRNKLSKEIENLGNRIRRELGIQIAELDENQSRFFKKIYINPPRMGDLNSYYKPRWANIHGDL